MAIALGKLVVYKGYIANGADEHPSVITNVHGAGEGAPCDLIVHPDGQSARVFVSRPVYSSRAAADADIVGAPKRRDGYAFLFDRSST
ncbi:hypothetical protein CNECB9_1150020 [Cupriavidus necator]|uniref:Uncharacterized protein n=1 Tax=Cupriavidus necator TaxID=106590 RepID=A0A1K0J6D4_CUPNE|nr:hypothetical protein CNECB9_1150020 [Cupriavidus necator]